MYVFREISPSPGCSVTGIFTDIAAVAILSPPHSTFASLRMAAVSPLLYQ